MWRNPQPRWASTQGRVIQIGDAAHPFLPSSASGATMAMEDAYSLAACLQIAGKGDISLAAKVHNHLRYVKPLISHPKVSRQMSFTIETYSVCVLWQIRAGLLCAEDGIQKPGVVSQYRLGCHCQEPRENG